MARHEWIPVNRPWQPGLLIFMCLARSTILHGADRAKASNSYLFMWPCKIENEGLVEQTTAGCTFSILLCDSSTVIYQHSPTKQTTGFHTKHRIIKSESKCIFKIYYFQSKATGYI